ncbi:uncharacterized protein [Argopecten irradians]|uniref:uncharacterized protein n=1 Tax=Argopecten irradians TaxID=31199 RepID=UPI00371D5752
MTVTKLVFIIVYVVHFGACINWTITMFIGGDPSLGRFYLDVHGTNSHLNGIYLGNRFRVNEVKLLNVNYNFGKIESARIYTSSSDGIWLTQLVMYDGTHSYTFPCSCWVDGLDSPSHTMTTFVSDPCELLPTTIPQLEMLRPTNILPIDSSAPLTDGWYSGGQYLLLTRSPALDSPRCGADSQIWMNGTFPVADGSKHARQLCITDRTSGDTCANTQSVYIENCTTHMMYELTTPPDNSAYCFDIPSDSTDPPPSYRPTKAKIKYELFWNSGLISNNALNSNLNEEPILRFICDFVRDTSNAYFYVVYFYVDGRYVNFGNDMIVTGNLEAFVTEKTLVSKFGYAAGINISCSIGVRSSRNGQTGSLVTSEGFYAGMKMLNESVPIERGRSATVYFQQTVPFGCMRTSSWFQNSGDCKLNLHIRKTSTENTCYSNTIQHRGQCDIEVRGETTSLNSDTWEPQIYSFELASVESMRGYFWLITRQFSFQLETSSSHHQFWENSKSDSVQVTVDEGADDRSWQGKHCRVFCDPHMMSFDGLKYELQYPGSFLLFKSENPPIQIQVEITSCNRNGRSPYCACGVLVVAGKDVFQIYLCNGPNYINYKSCLDGVLRVIKRTTKNYEIYLPTGAVVRVWLRSNGLLDVDITPTFHEYRGSVSGLCGDFDGDINNDCVSKDGSLPCREKPIPNQRPYSYHPNSFTQSYRLSAAENLLNTNIDTDLLPSYPRSHETCSCANGIHESPQCSARQYAICPNPGKEVICTAIKETTLRKKRRAERINNNYQHHDIIKRSTVINESEAIQLCTEALNTVTNEACSQIGVNSSSDEIDNCAADLMLTGDGNWTKYAIDRSESLCLETLEKNTTLQEENPDISNIIRNNTCPLNCSERGSCSNGKCVCQDGFASDDCSFDLNKPLQNLGLENDGLCDIDEGCSYVVVEALEFPSDINITCQFSGQATLVGDISHTMDESNVTADLNTLFTIICELPVNDTPSDRLGIEYNVSVALDGFGFSDPINFVVIDTACQDYVNNSGKITFYIKDGFCYINGTCYPEGSYKENALCLECRPEENLYMWSNSSNEDCVVSDKETVDPSDDVIIIVISAVTGSLSAGLLVCALCCFCKKKEKSNQEVEDISINDAVDEEEGKPCIARFDDDELNTGNQIEEKTKSWQPKWNHWTAIPKIRSAKHHLQDSIVQDTFHIANESTKCVEVTEQDYQIETSNHVKRANSVDNIFDKDNKQTSITSPHLMIDENRIPKEVENEADRTQTDGDITLDTPNTATGLQFWIYNENQPTSDIETNNTSIGEGSKEKESKEPSDISVDKGRRKKKKRKRERRKVEPECSIGDLAIITEDDNDRREKKKSRKKSKRQKKDISPQPKPTSIDGGKWDEKEEVASLPNEGIPGSSRNEVKTEDDGVRTDSNNSHLIFVRSSTEANLDFANIYEAEPDKDTPKSNTGTKEAEIIEQISNLSPQTPDVPSTERDLSDDTCITNPTTTAAAITNPFLKEDAKAREPNLLESILQLDKSENKRKSRMKKKRKHREEELESPIEDRRVMTEHLNRRERRLMKNEDIDHKDGISQNVEDNNSNICSDEGARVATEQKVKASENENKMETGKDTDKIILSQNDKHLDIPSLELFGNDEANIDTQSDISVVFDDSCTDDVIGDGEAAPLETILQPTATVEKGKQRKKKKRRRKKKKVVPLPSNGKPALATHKGNEKKVPKKSKKNIKKK